MRPDIPRFINTVQAKFLPDGRNMQLLADFGYQSADSKFWRVPKGTVVDGASIPRILWTVVGPPFVGKYRDASVVHDYFCETKSEPWRAVHYMFYEACLTSKVDSILAKILYAGVFAGGPRCVVKSQRGLKSFTALRMSTYFADSASPVNDRHQFEQLMVWIENTDPDIGQIERYINTKL